MEIRACRRKGVASLHDLATESLNWRLQHFAHELERTVEDTRNRQKDHRELW